VSTKVSMFLFCSNLFSSVLDSASVRSASIHRDFSTDVNSKGNLRSLCRPRIRNVQRGIVGCFCRPVSLPTAGYCAGKQYAEIMDRGCVGKIIGGTFIPPYSESIGRKYIYIISCFIFLVTNITVAAVPSMNAVYISRFFMGFTSAIPAVVTAGSIEDIYDGTGRIWAIYIWVSAASFALGLGPIYGAYIAASIGWYFSASTSSLYF
jgi:MFS family permease